MSVNFGIDFSDLLPLNHLIDETIVAIPDSTIISSQYIVKYFF